MKENPFSRFRSGEICREDGWYEFDGYVDHSTEPAPALSEIEVPLRAGEAFPPVHKARKPCYWKPINGLYGAQGGEAFPTAVDV